jgi:antitoxin component YwqK of YwqJK toxin-antitoxin module
MKANYILLLCFIIIGCSNADNPNPLSNRNKCLIQTIQAEIPNLGNGLSYSKFEYDKFDNVLKIIFQNSNGQVSIKNYVNSYNSKSQLTKFVIKDESTLIETSTFEYHLNGKISKHTKESSGFQTVYEYNEKGNQISLVFSDGSSILSKSLTKYNENGQVIKSEIIENGTLKSEITNTYNSKNLLIESIIKYPESQIINKYEYNNVGQIIKYSNQNGYSTEYIYENGLLIFEKNFKNGTFTYVIKSTYDQNKQVKNKSISTNSVDYNFLEEFTYHENQKVKLNIKYQFTLSPKNGLQKISELEYDEFGNEIRILRYNETNGQLNYAAKKTYLCK